MPHPYLMIASELREAILYQTDLEIHLHELWTEIFSGFQSFGIITKLNISDALWCVFGQSSVDNREVGNSR